MTNDYVVAELGCAPRRGIALVAHDNKKPDLLRVACNVASADLMISSPLLAGGYAPVRPEFGDRPAPDDPSGRPGHAVVDAVGLLRRLAHDGRARGWP